MNTLYMASQSGVSRQAVSSNGLHLYSLKLILPDRYMSLYTRIAAPAATIAFCKCALSGLGLAGEGRYSRIVAIWTFRFCHWVEHQPYPSEASVRQSCIRLSMESNHSGGGTDPRGLWRR